MSERLLTFELHTTEKAKELFIHGSANDLTELAQSLLRLVQKTKEGHFDHDHLMSAEWGGSELTSTPQSEGTELLNHVKVYCWKGSICQM